MGVRNTFWSGVAVSIPLDGWIWEQVLTDWVSLAIKSAEESDDSYCGR